MQGHILTGTGKIVQQMDSSKLSKERQRLKALLTKEAKGEIPEGTAQNSLQAWLANADRGNTFFQQKRMIDYYQKTEGELKRWQVQQSKKECLS